jgi:hypothetical protein
MRLPNYGTNELSTLSEDMRVLDALTGGRKKPLAEETELQGMAVTVGLDEGKSYGGDMSDADKKKAHKKAMKNKKNHSYMGDMSYGEDEDVDEDDELFDEAVEEDEDDEEFDVEAFFAEDSNLEDDDDDEDEDLDEGEITDEDVENAVEILESYADLDEDEIDELSEDDVALVESAYLLLERGKAGGRVGKDDPEYFKAKSKSTYGGFKRKKMGAAFAPVGRLRKKLWKNLKAGGLVTRKPKNTPALKGALAIRAISRMAGTDITARNLAAQFGKQAIKKLAALKAMSPEKRKAKAKAWLVGKHKGSKLIGQRKLMRQNREARRKPAAAFDPAFVESTNDLNTLIEEFRGVLNEGLSTEVEADSYESCETIIEGFQKVGASAEELAGRVATDMRNLPESEDPREDPRFEIGCFLESIARDAGSCLDRLITVDEEGNPYFAEDVDVDTALEDLQNITNDLERGIGALADLDD